MKIRVNGEWPIRDEIKARQQDLMLGKWNENKRNYKNELYKTDEEENIRMTQWMQGKCGKLRNLLRKKEIEERGTEN